MPPAKMETDPRRSRGAGPLANVAIAAGRSQSVPRYFMISFKPAVVLYILMSSKFSPL